MFKLTHHLTAAVVGVLMLAQSIVLPTAAPRKEAAPAPKPAVVAMVATEPVANPAPQAKGKLIVIDPGHGGSDPGALHQAGNGQADVTEEDANLAIALKLADMLRADGYEVRVTRSTDTELVPGSKAADLQKRVDIANEANADLLISIHHNAAANKSARGTEVWYCADRPFSADGERLAKAVDEAIVRNLRAAGYETVDHGVKDDSKAGHFAITGPNLARPSKMPSIIGEALYITNDQDAAQLKRPEGIEALARGYFEGIKAYFGDA